MPRKLGAIFVITASLLGIVALINDKYYWLINIAFILMSVNLFFLGIQSFKANKKSLFAYCIVAMALLIIILSILKVIELIVSKGQYLGT